MELPAKVIVFSPGMEIKNKPASLMLISPHGYYELQMEFNGKRHVILAPISQTGLIFNDPEEDVGTLSGIER
jgi:hypothetical protein